MGILTVFKKKCLSLEDIDVKKSIQPKGLYFTRPSMWHYLGTQDELKVAADIMFEKIKFGQIKINIFKKYRSYNS